MTKRRWLTVVGLLACLVCVPLLVLAILPDNRNGVTQGNFNCIQEGMTLKDVEDIFGERAGRVHFAPTAARAREEVFFWDSGRGSQVFVTFTEGQVTEKEWIPFTETVLQKLRRWLHL